MVQKARRSDTVLAAKTSGAGDLLSVDHDGKVFHVFQFGFFVPFFSVNPKVA